MKTARRGVDRGGEEEKIRRVTKSSRRRALDQRNRDNVKGRDRMLSDL